MASHGIAGLWTPVVVRLYVYSIPAIMLAIWIGGRINSRIPTDLFSRIVYGLLVVIGVLFMI